MPTPTEMLEDFVTAFELVYSAPTFSAVTAGAEEGDVYIDTTSKWIMLERDSEGS